MANRGRKVYSRPMKAHVAKCSLIVLLLQGAAVAHAGQPMHIVEQEQGSAAVPAQHCPELAKAARRAPEPVPHLDEYLDAHYESLREAPGLFPAQALIRFKTPVAPVS